MTHLCSRQIRQFQSCSSLRNPALALLVATAWLSTAPLAEAQIRVGPTDPGNGFPMWYEDDTGLRLALCTNEAAGCFFETPNPALPVSFPDNFADEAFYWVSEAFITNPGGRNAILVMAREGAFDPEVMAHGNQVVFSRTRFYIDGIPEMVGNTYTITYPYGTRQFVPVPGDAGPGVQGEGYSTTKDVGLLAMEFSGSLAEFPTFLIPATANRELLKNSPGTSISEQPAQQTRVQGSPTGNNFFRIEGPFIGDAYPNFLCADPGLGHDPVATNDCVETDLFSMMGQVASRFGAQVDAAIYSKVDIDPLSPDINDPLVYVDVWAHTVEGQSLAARIDGGPQTLMAEGLGGNYFVRLEEGSDFLPMPLGARKPLSVEVTNLTDNPLTSQTASIIDRVVITRAEWNTDAGTLEVTAQTTNVMNQSQMDISFEPYAGSLQGNWTNGGAGSGTGIYYKSTPQAPDTPPLRVRVSSLDGGSAVREVLVSGGNSIAGQVEELAANAGPDQSVPAGTIVTLNAANSIGPIVGYYWSTASGLYWQCINPSCSQIEVTTPVSDAMTVDKLHADFTLTITDASLGEATDVVSVTVTNPALAPSDECTIASALYNVDKEFWRLTGTSDTPDNQRIFVYVGSTAFDPLTSRLLGETRVNALGDWEIRTPRDSAVTNNQVPTLQDTLVWIESERGCSVTRGFITKD